MNRRLLIPLAIFVVLAGFLFAGLWRDPREVPSPLIGKPAPAFALAELHAPQRTLGTIDMKGKVWASWCESCRVEHPLLVALAKEKIVPIIGLDYKDDPAAGTRWLANHGDPYTASVMDRDGRVGIDFGVYGAPETFLIDKAGIIRYKQIGPLTKEALEKTIFPLIETLQKS